jgi:hypothetical protein
MKRYIRVGKVEKEGEIKGERGKKCTKTEKTEWNAGIKIDGRKMKRER